MKTSLFFVLLVIVLLLISVFCLTVGSSKISFKDTVYAVMHPETDGVNNTIIWDIRLPRILLAILIGAGLSASGCVFQGILRNPLADPYTLGISGGAALGVTLGTILGFQSFLGYFSYPLAAFAGAMLSVSIVYAVASRKYFSVPTLILTGVILSFVFSSVVLLIFSISRASDVHNTLLWLMGNLSSANIELIKTISIFVISGILVLFVLSRDIDILSLGEEKATNLGLKTENTRKLLFVITSLVTGACVSAAGMIGFVGLLIPHFVRQITGPKHIVLIPGAVLAGSIFLVLADTTARIVVAPIELPVGVITGILGGVFLMLYLFGKKKWELF